MGGTASGMRRIFGQASWRLAGTNVELYLTRDAGHLGPITFMHGRRHITPLSVAPWHSEKLPADTPTIIRVLRGDFFCAPFGGNDDTWQGEKHPIHGESANQRWSLDSIENAAGRHTLDATLKTVARPGRIDKRITLIDGQPIVYQQHAITSMTGPMPIGHHLMVHFPDQARPGLIATSPFTFGQVYPGQFEDPAEGGYTCLKQGAMFKSLSKVPKPGGSLADLSQYPARLGYEDLVMLVHKQQASPLAWTAVTVPGEYVLVTLKDVRVLPNLVMWHSNRGRHYGPWSGRHVGVIGLEDTCSHFHDGIAKSAAPNDLTRRGYRTAVQLSPDEPTVVRYAVACVPVDDTFGKVASVADRDGQLTIADTHGQSIALPWERELVLS